MPEARRAADADLNGLLDRHDFCEIIATLLEISRQLASACETLQHEVWLASEATPKAPNVETGGPGLEIGLPPGVLENARGTTSL